MNSKDESKKLVDEVQMFRTRTATAESKLKVLTNKARHAQAALQTGEATSQRPWSDSLRFS